MVVQCSSAHSQMNGTASSSSVPYCLAYGSRTSNDAVDNSRERRRGMNEAIFREVNERIAGLSKRFRRSEDEPLDLVCECRKATYAQRIEMSRTEYEALRAQATHFAVYPGHADPKSGMSSPRTRDTRS